MSDVPVFVMLPLDTVNHRGVFQYAGTQWFQRALEFLSNSGVKGVALDCWWGIVERTPKKYDFSAYRHVCKVLRRYNLKMQVVMSFHACGNNVNDDVTIPLPEWVLECGRRDPDLWFSSAPSGGGSARRNEECVSLFADTARCLAGRTPVECYADAMAAFAAAMSDLLGSVVVEVVVGMGPCGELRYPSYTEAHGWRFPGIGQFQVYDRRARASLARAARDVGRPEWGYGPPDGTGGCNSQPQDTLFFTWNGSWQSPQGAFFLSWYSAALLEHADRLLQAAVRIFYPFVGAATQADIRARGRVATAELPTEPPVRRNSSDAALDLATASAVAAASGASERRAAVLARCALEQRNGGAHMPRDCGDAAGGGGVAFAAPRDPGPLGSASASGSTDTSTVVLCRPALPSHDGEAGALAACALGADNAEARAASAAGDCAADGCGGAGVARGGAPANGLVWEEARVDGEGGGRRAPPRVHSACSTVSMASTPANPASRAPLRVSIKVAGVHWWYHSPSHAAELTAGYYNTSCRNGYEGLLQVCAECCAGIILTCVEMTDAQHPPEALCGPEELLRQVRVSAHALGLRIAGENALPCITGDGVNMHALDVIVRNTKASHSIPRRASDVATRALAQRHYHEAAHGAQAAALPQGPMPLPHSISFSPPMQQYFIEGGLRRCADAGMRKAPSSIDVSSAAAEPTGAAWPARGRAEGGPGKASLQSLSDAIPEGVAVEEGVHFGVDGLPSAWAHPGSPSPLSEPTAGAGEDGGAVPPMRMFTFLRLTKDMIQPGCSGPWMHFMSRMRPRQLRSLCDGL